MKDMMNMTENSIFVLGLDPGTKNFGYSVVKVSTRIVGKERTLVSKPIVSGILEHTVLNLRNPKPELQSFLLNVESIFHNRKHPCSQISIEQFQSRGHGTKLLELVNIMMGALLHNFLLVETAIQPPAVWKRAVKSKFDLDKEYKVISCEPHELDATLIALYGSFRMFDIKPFHGYKSSHFSSIARKVEKVSTTPKRTRRLKR